MKNPVKNRQNYRFRSFSFFSFFFFLSLFFCDRVSRMGAMALHWWTSLSLPLKLSVAALHIALIAVPASCSIVTEADVLSSVNACIGRQCHSLHALADVIVTYGGPPMSTLRTHEFVGPFNRCCTSCSSVSGCSNSRSEEYIFADLLLPHLQRGSRVRALVCIPFVQEIGNQCNTKSFHAMCVAGLLQTSLY